MSELTLDEIRKLIFNQEYEKALSLLCKAPADVCQNNEAIALSARAHAQLGDLNQALVMFEDLEAAWPDRREIYKLHVEFLQEAGQIGTAVEKSLHLLALFPDYKDSYLLAVDCCELGGDTDQAWNLVMIARERWPDCEKIIERQQRLSPIQQKKNQLESSLAIVRDELSINHAQIVITDDLLNDYLNLFKGREGVHAQQKEFKRKKFGYIPVYENLNQKLLRKHLAGDITLGIYIVKKADTCSLMVFDLDVNKSCLKAFLEEHSERKRIIGLLNDTAKEILNIAHEAGIQPLIEQSGYKGLHLWLFSDFEIPARHWRLLGQWIINRLAGVPPELHIEVFPKQDKVSENGLGNLVKLPLGIHKLSNKRSFFVDETDFKPFAMQHEPLIAFPAITRSEFEEILGRMTVSKYQTDHDTYSKASTSKINVSKKAERKNVLSSSPDFDLKVTIPLPDRFAPEIEQILAWCKPLSEIFTVAINEKVMKPAERHVFIYIFAALGEEGKIFIHQVMNQLSGYDPDELNAAIKAVPPTTMSCNKVRKNLKHLIEKTGCNCQFRLPDGCYASPVVHAGIFPGTNKTIIKPINQPVAISTKELIAGNSASIDKLMKEYKLLKTQQENLNARLRILKDQINRIFEQSGSEEITTSIGTYCRLVSENESANSGNSSD